MIGRCDRVARRTDGRNGVTGGTCCWAGRRSGWQRCRRYNTFVFIFLVMMVCVEAKASEAPRRAASPALGSTALRVSCHVLCPARCFRARQPDARFGRLRRAGCRVPAGGVPER